MKTTTESPRITWIRPLCFFLISLILIAGCTGGGSEGDDPGGGDESAANQTPVAVLTTSVTEGTLPLDVTFDGSSSSDPDGDSLVFEWDFGDGTIAAQGEETVTHTYATGGLFTAVLTVTDPDGAANSSSIDITVQATEDQQITVPDLAGMTQTDAETAITDIGLVVGTVTTENSNTITAGSVIRQNPPADTTVDAGVTVNIVISAEILQVTVPDVVGQMQIDAETAITDVGLVIGVVTSENSDTVPADSVISQDPAAGAVIDTGASINLVVSAGAIQQGGQYTLDLSIVGGGSVTLDPPGGGYDENTVVTLTAISQADGGDGWGYAFSGWSGDLNGSDLTTSITMDADKDITATFNLANRLLVKDHDYQGPDYRDTVWLITSVRNENGDFISDLGVENFQLTEQIIARSDNSVKAEAAIDLVAFEADGNPMLGLAKTIFGHQPLDIVILLDSTGTIDPYYADLKLQMTSLVNEMVAHHVDFRMAYRAFDSGVGGDAYFDFHGPQEVDELLQEINALTTAGEWWRPTAAYDALLFTPWLGFRKNARKVCVVITDVVPRTVYGAYWYGVETATRSAVELFLQASGVELYYAQRDWEHGDIHLYFQDDINPRAGDAASGFAVLKDTAGGPLATQLSFPFDGEELKTALGIDTAQTVVDTEYVLSWTSAFDRWDTVEDDALIYHPDDYEMRVVLKVPDPDQAGEFLQASCTYPIEKEKFTAVINALGEEGTAPIDLGYTLDMKMGGRDIRTKWGNALPSGQINILNTPPGTYNLELFDGGSSPYTYHSLRAMVRDTITVDAASLTFDMTVPVADQAAELYRTRGLLKDIADWRLPGDPFQAMVDEAEAWLDAMLSDGLSWEEMTAIKRFQVALGGFANVIEYSQLEAEKAIQDFDTIVQNFRDIVEEVDKIGNNTEDEWAAEVGSIAMQAVMALMGQVQFTLEKEALEAAIEELIDYAADEITQDLRDKIIEKLPIGDYNALLQTIVNTLIDADFGGDSFDWDSVIAAMQTITLDQAIAEVRARVSAAAAGAIVSGALDDLPLSGSLTEELKTLIDTILTALISGDISGDTLSTAMQTFASSLLDDVQSAAPEAIAAAVNTAFNAVGVALNSAGVDADVSGLLVGMARDLTLQAIPQNDGGVPQVSVDTDAVVSVLIKYGVYYVILRDYCIDDIQTGLEQMLADAKSYVPTGEDRGDWVPDMQHDFDDYADLVEDLQTTAWNALRSQNAISEWAAQMQQLCDLLDAISEPLDTIANLYPDLQNTADNVHSFIAVLDGMQILANATSFGLKVDALDTFGNQAQPMHQALFY